MTISASTQPRTAGGEQGRSCRHGRRADVATEAGSSWGSAPEVGGAPSRRRAPGRRDAWTRRFDGLPCAACAGRDPDLLHRRRDARRVQGVALRVRRETPYRRKNEGPRLSRGPSGRAVRVGFSTRGLSAEVASPESSWAYRSDHSQAILIAAMGSWVGLEIRPTAQRPAGGISAHSFRSEELIRSSW